MHNLPQIFTLHRLPPLQINTIKITTSISECVFVCFDQGYCCIVQLRGNLKKQYICGHCPYRREGGQPHVKNLNEIIFYQSWRGRWSHNIFSKIEALYCQARPKLQQAQAGAELALFSQSPTNHPPTHPRESLFSAPEILHRQNEAQPSISTAKPTP